MDAKLWKSPARRLKARWRLVRRMGFGAYAARPLFALLLLFLFFAFFIASLKNRGVPARFEAALAERQLHDR